MQKKNFIAVCAGLSLLMTLSPWILKSKGEFLGISYSLRSLGNALGAVLGLMGVGLLLSSTLRQKTRQFIQQLESLPSREQMFWIMGSTFLYAIPVISHKLKAHASLDTHAWDLGFFSNICWNIAFAGRGGEWFFSSMLERNFMAVHVNWILWPLSIFYRWGGDARVLLVAQAVLLSAAIPFLWLTARKITGSFSVGFVTGMLYACSPFIAKSMSNDFHPDVWQVPCLAAALWGLYRNSKEIVIGSCFLALLAKEDVSFVLAGFSILLLFKREWRATGVVVMAAALGAFFFHVLVYIPKFVDSNMASLNFERYPLLGGSFSEMTKNLFVAPSHYLQALFYDPLKFWRLFKMFLPALGLTFLAPLYLIPCLVSVAPHIMSQASTQLQLADIYALPLQPFIFVGAMHGLVALRTKPWLQGKEILALGAALLVAALGIANSPRYYRMQKPERLQAFAELKPLIPPKASVVAQQNLFSHFDTRRTAQLFPIGPVMGNLQKTSITNPDYIVGDTRGNSIPYSKERVEQDIAALKTDPHYQIIFEKEGFVVFKRNEPSLR